MQAFADGLQHDIASPMADAVVYGFEAIKVDE
jgi:hypothetical protein